MSDVWEEIGYVMSEEPKRPKYPPPPEKKPSDWDKQFVGREAKNLAMITSLGVDMEMSGGMVTVSVKGRKVDFWPRSDTWYSHAKKAFGVDVGKLVETMKVHQKSLA